MILETSCAFGRLCINRLRFNAHRAMLRSFVRQLRSGLRTKTFALSQLFRSDMSPPRYFENPYLAEDEEKSKEPVNVEKDLKEAREYLRKTIERIVKKEGAESADREGGLYVGAAGIAYAFLHVSLQLSSEAETAKNYLSLAQRYLEPSLRDLEKLRNRVDCGFLLGHGGIVAVGAVVAFRAGDAARSNAFAKRYVGMAELCKPEAFLSAGSDEFLVGRAGYLYGSLWLNRQLGHSVVPVELMRELASVVVLSGKNYARKHRSPCPLMYAYYGTEYLGAAHGLAGILQVLIQVPGFLETNKEAESLVRTSVDYLLSLETPTGNYPSALDEVDSSGRDRRGEVNELVHWCHGAPGVVYLMAAAYLHWKDRRYLEACERSGELVWRKGLLKKGPGICHGIAGSGYVFLLLYRLTSDHRHLRRALKFADFIHSENFKHGARTPDCPYSLYEGIAGTACFLADLIHPDKAAFPFQDVF